MKKVKITASAMVLVLLMCGFACNASNWERTTFQSLAASKAVIDQAQADYEGGTLPHSKLVYDTVNEAKAAQVAAVQSMSTYEALKANGSPAANLNAAQTDVATALAKLPALIGAVKGLYTSTKAVTK